ncbi:MAG: NAD(P)/FAD-dependent oxidoreductase [Spirochaetes bacterium]|nr:NAD(P)/FAD-dependent oxidoreductase [Spirochaetota bacterium]
MGKEKYYDAIIIGAGLSGLTLGNILLTKGRKVLIIDKNPVPGGCVVNFKRKDFRFDSAIHFINGCGEGGIVDNIMKSFGAEKKVEWLHIDNLIHWKDTQNNYEAHPPVWIDEYIEFLCKEFPAEEKNIRKFYRRYGKAIPAMFGIIKPGIWPKLKGFILGMPAMIRVTLNMFKTVNDVVLKYFKDQALIELVTLFCAPFGMDRKDEAFITWSMSELSYHVEGAWYPKGGAGEFTKALGDHFVEKGGELLLAHEVTDIEIDQKAKLAKSVNCVDRRGNTKNFSSAVVVNTGDLVRFAKQLVPKGTFTEEKIKKMDHPTIGALFMVYIGLDFDVKDRGITTWEYWLLNSQWRKKENYDKIRYKRDFSQIPCEVVTFYSNGPDKTCCPPGKSLISILQPCHIFSWNELLEPDGSKGNRYYDEKEKCAWYFVDRLAELLKMPDLRNHIEVMEVATPITSYQWNWALNGCPIGYEFTVDSLKKSNLFWTPIKNLYVAGQFTIPGGGMSAAMMSGWAAAPFVNMGIKKYKKVLG